MSIYEEISRKALINVCKKFDAEHDNAMLDFAEAEDKKERLPRIKPFYFQVEKVESVYDKANGKVNNVVDSLINKADAIVTAVTANTPETSKVRS